MNPPLYVRYMKGIYENNEELDKASLLWLKRELHITKFYLKDINEKLIPIEESKFRRFIPKTKWFKKNPLIGIHGLSHILRVMIYTYILCQIENEKRIDPFMIAASIHDLRRSIDKREEEHGLNAAKWFLKNKKLFKYLDKEEIIPIEFAISYHDTYKKEELSDKSDTRIFNILKTADALDRFRLPKREWWPKQEFVPIKLDRKLIKFAKNFVIQTEKDILEGRDIVKTIIKFGKRYGVIKR